MLPTERIKLTTDGLQYQGWNSEHIWEALIPKNHDISRHPLTWIGLQNKLSHSKPITGTV